MLLSQEAGASSVAQSPVDQKASAGFPVSFPQAFPETHCVKGRVNLNPTSRHWEKVPLRWAQHIWGLGMVTTTWVPLPCLLGSTWESAEA